MASEKSITEFKVIREDLHEKVIRHIWSFGRIADCVSLAVVFHRKSKISRIEKHHIEN